MRLLTSAIALLSALLAGGCGSDAASPLTPSSTVRPPGVAVSDGWKLTTTLTSVTGPAICFDRRTAVGTSIDWLLEVRRAGAALTLLYDVRNYPIDHIELVGTIEGDAFTASTSWPGYQPCDGARVNYQFESRVAGRFSTDGRAITAKETWTYRLDSGEAVVLSFDWGAERH